MGQSKHSGEKKPLGNEDTSNHKILEKSCNDFNISTSAERAIKLFKGFQYVFENMSWEGEQPPLSCVRHG
uniref:Uncharacterized protein n=1 Tax=Romanomermis culicivorax TaxID=13658 RepID=A0A915JSC3_ROMCU